MRARSPSNRSALIRMRPDPVCGTIYNWKVGAAHAAKGREAMDVSGERILVVEDERAIANVLRRGLALEGYTVEMADGGRAALDAVRDRPPELVVLDWMLPDIDGLEVARRLREAGEHIPVLMLTARDRVADRVRGLDAGADDYLAKPFAFEELLARVRACCAAPPPRRKAARTLRRLSSPIWYWIWARVTYGAATTRSS